jgi:uncharacterized SAM-binding protein YcdF (DUF218 family)
VIDEKPIARSRFGGFAGALRLLFDALLFVFVVFIIGFLVFARGIDRSQSEPRASADGIAVLTGGAARIDEAMKLLAQQKAKRLLITGVNRTTSLEELKRLSSQDDALFACCVDIDKEARNTIDNATETSQWVARNRYDSIIVVTSNYHMPRALAELGRVMPSVTLVPYSVVDNNARIERWWAYPGTTRLLISEYVKFLPAVGRLAATQAVSKILTGKARVPVEDASEP